MKDLYLVTGAAGHLGLTVVEELIKEGKTVRALVLPGDKAAGKLPAGVEICEGDVLKPASLDAFFAHGDGENLIVIHCAGVVSIASRFIQKVYDVNFKGTQNIVEMCETYGAKKLVYVSSVHAIPELPAGQVMTEIDDFHPADVVGQYAQTKSAASACVLEAAKRGLNASIVHPSGICGPNDWGAATSPSLPSTIVRAACPRASRADTILWTCAMWPAPSWPAAKRGSAASATSSPTAM